MVCSAVPTVGCVGIQVILIRYYGIIIQFNHLTASLRARPLCQLKKTSLTHDKNSNFNRTIRVITSPGIVLDNRKIFECVKW